MPAQKTTTKIHNTPPNESCVTAVLRTASKRSYTYARNKTAVTTTSSFPLLNSSCFHPPKVRFVLNPTLNAMHHTAATHTHLHSKLENGNEEIVWLASHMTQWICGHKTQNSLFQLERTCSDHLVLLPPPCFRANQKLKHVVKCIFHMPLKYWQAWGIDHLPKDLFQCLTVKLA